MWKEFVSPHPALTAMADVAPATFGISSIHGGQMAEMQIPQERRHRYGYYCYVSAVGQHDTKSASQRDKGSMELTVLREGN